MDGGGVQATSAADEAEPDPRPARDRIRDTRVPPTELEFPKLKGKLGPRAVPVVKPIAGKEF